MPLPHPQPSHAATKPQRVLVVEDSALVVVMIKTMLADMGWETVGPATRLADAVALAGTEAIDLALLDVNLAGEMSWPVAEVLQVRGIPFAFTTGYDADSVIPPSLASAPVVAKPFSNDDLEACLYRMSSDSGAG